MLYRAIQDLRNSILYFVMLESDHPNYLILAKMAEMYLKGDHGLNKDPSSAGDYYTQAADEAMGSMKGKLANKYYMLAEEAWAEC